MKIHANARTCPHCRALIVSRVIEETERPTAVAKLFRVSVPTVNKWVKRFRREGLEGLEDRTFRPHRIPRQLLKPGKGLHEAVMSVLHTPPIECGFNRTTWRLRDLRNALVAKGIVASQSNIREVIRKAGYQWKKARVSLTSTDPEYRSKLDAIKATLARLEPDEAFFSIDELGPVAVKMRGGLSLQPPGTVRTVPQWQRSRAPGHEVVFSYARSEQKLRRLAREAKGKARAGTPREAAQEVDALLLAVRSIPYRAKFCSACTRRSARPGGRAWSTVATMRGARKWRRA